MSVSPEELMAYVDGELDAAAEARVEAEAAADPRLRVEIDRQKALARNLRTAFAEGADVPERLLQTAREAPISRRYRARRTASQLSQNFRTRRFWVGSGVPVSAALACGLLLGIALAPAMRSPLLEYEGTRGLVAKGALASALDHQLASEQSGSEAVEIGVSYRARDGRYCRSFVAETQSGVACRDNSGWRVAVVAQKSNEQSGAYQQAGSAMSSVVRSMIESNIAGAPFDASAERRARARDWQ